MCFTSRFGGAPNMRARSRLNCDALSKLTWKDAVSTLRALEIITRRASSSGAASDTVAASTTSAPELTVEGRRAELRDRAAGSSIRTISLKDFATVHLLASKTRPTEGVSTPITRACPALYSSRLPPNVAHLAPCATIHMAGMEKSIIPLLVPLMKFLSTPKRAARWITKVLIDASDRTGVNYDEGGHPMLGSMLARDPKFTERVVAETRALLSSVSA
jgi:hypothetical protein